MKGQADILTGFFLIIVLVVVVIGLLYLDTLATAVRGKIVQEELALGEFIDKRNDFLYCFGSPIDVTRLGELEGYIEDCEISFSFLVSQFQIYNCQERNWSSSENIRFTRQAVYPVAIKNGTQNCVGRLEIYGTS
ncbi:MAG: hypothetical protein ACMXYF_05250 [Candidatus Woesearchaeota archaeon]